MILALLIVGTALTVVSVILAALGAPPRWTWLCVAVSGVLYCAVSTLEGHWWFLAIQAPLATAALLLAARLFDRRMAERR